MTDNLSQSHDSPHHVRHLYMTYLQHNLRLARQPVNIHRNFQFSKIWQTFVILRGYPSALLIAVFGHIVIMSTLLTQLFTDSKLFFVGFLRVD